MLESLSFKNSGPHCIVGLDATVLNIYFCVANKAYSFSFCIYSKVPAATRSVLFFVVLFFV